MPNRRPIDWEYDDTPDPDAGLPAGQIAASTKDMQQAAEMIHAAKRPVILAGQGVLLSGAMES